MLPSPAYVVAALLATITNACTICTNESPEPIELSPAPWTLRGDIYMVFMLPGLLPETGLPLLPTSSANLPAKAFPPFERQYPASIAGQYVGKIGLIQVLRYTESPVGPYDELLIVPGFFGYQNNGKYEEGIRVSRIYVSQKYTAWNGRHSTHSCTLLPLHVYYHHLMHSRLEHPKTPRPLRLDIFTRRLRERENLPVRHIILPSRSLCERETFLPNDLLSSPPRELVK